MRRFSFLLIIICSLTLVGCGEKPISPTELPQEVQTFVKQNFANSTITFAQKEWGLFGSEYDVTLNDGTMISFNRNKEWDKVSSTTAPIPTAIVPAPIASHISTSFPGVSITKIDKDDNGYEVELINGLELKFNQQGALMEMDD